MRNSEQYRYHAKGHTDLQKPDTLTRKRVRGVLHTPVGAEHGQIAPTSRDVAEYIEHFWWARWHLHEPREAEVLTYPSVHVVFEDGEEHIVGVVRAKFTRRLIGTGEVFGIKFRPGMFRPISTSSVDKMTNRVVPLRDELGCSAADIGREVRVRTSPEERAQFIEPTLQRMLPQPPQRALMARDLVERVRSDPELRSVALLTEDADINERALQRLFRDFVGVSPKWVVNRFRLQEAAELLATTSETIASVAAHLGYFDQAHFARAFKSVVGQAPIEFVAKNRVR
jgi:AraC-like DNA-binding protein